jgi:hypothetical protein
MWTAHVDSIGYTVTGRSQCYSRVRTQKIEHRKRHNHCSNQICISWSIIPINTNEIHKLRRRRPRWYFNENSVVESTI